MGTAADIRRGNRIYWMDNLRSITILLVVLYHVGGVYEAAGLWGWFWIVDDPATLTWVGILGIMFDIMVMPIMFFIAGYLVPPSLENRTPGAFIKGKFKRLMIPWLIAVSILIPVYKFIFLYSRNLPQEVWTSYFHITHPNSQNWLWFLPVLFAFNLIYLLITKLPVKLPGLSLKKMIWGTLILSFLYSFIVGGLVGFRSWTLTPVFDFENERLVLYLLAFLLGGYFFRSGVFAERPKGKMLYNIVNGIAWIPVTAHIFARILPFFYLDEFAITPVYRLVWWLTFDLSLISLMFVMIESFRRYFDKPGPIWDHLNRNSYGVYVIHVIYIGVFGTLLLNHELPALVKYPTLFILTYGVGNFTITFYRLIKQKIMSGKDH